MNFWDLCVVCGRAIGRGCAALWRLLAHMLRLSWRYWWLVLALVFLAVAVALYHTREANITFKMNAVAFVNGASLPQFEQAFAPLRSSRSIPDDAAILPFIKEHQVQAFQTFRVVDCRHDGVADFVDFKRKSSPKDTLNVQMQDRLCLQFRIKSRDLKKLPEVEQALLDFLNANEALQQSFGTYRRNLEAEVAFNHAQALKLDSLTSVYYFAGTVPVQPAAYSGNGVNFYGDRHIRLFLEEIYKQQQHLQQGDYRLQLATAPVVLENHFVADPKPVNGRRQCVALLFLLGWVAGCLLAEVIDKRKAIIAWLKA